jgi:hypothetical protein
MSAPTIYAANALLDGTALPQTLYIKAHTGNPGANATANAANETDRAALTWGAATGGAASNDAVVEWVGVSFDETWTHWSAWDAATGGNPWLVGVVKQSGVANPLVVEVGNTVRIGIGDFDLSVPTWT